MKDNHDYHQKKMKDNHYLFVGDGILNDPYQFLIKKKKNVPYQFDCEVLIDQKEKVQMCTY